MYINTIAGKPLSPREKEICKGLEYGLTNQQIADLINIKKSGVDCHVSTIFKKLGITSRKELLKKRMQEAI